MLGFRSNTQQSRCTQYREVNLDHPYTVNSTKALGMQTAIHLHKKTKTQKCVNFQSFQKALIPVWSPYLSLLSCLIPDFSVEPIFEALSHCASLHPDPHGEEDDLDDAFLDVNGTSFDTFTGDENEELSEVGRVRSDFINDNRFAPY